MFRYLSEASPWPCRANSPRWQGPVKDWVIMTALSVRGNLHQGW